MRVGSMRQPLLCCMALCSLVALSSLLLIATPVHATDPSVCLRMESVSYDCNAHSCNCNSCHSCGCSTKIFGSCEWDSCSGSCWCSPFGCSCCYVSNCAYPCSCQTCYDTCQRLQCAESQSYSVSYILPTEGPLGGGSSIVVHGSTYAHTGEIQCRFGGGGAGGDAGVQTEGVWIDTGRIGCLSPPAPQGLLGPVDLEVSLDGGANFTTNAVQFTYSNCTSCSSDCEPGKAGSHCTLSCDASCIGGGHGRCQTEISAATGAEEAFCLCNQGWFTTVGSLTSCGSECPGGESNSCNGQGLCDGTTGLCDCDHAHFGQACEHTCPGAIGNTTANMKACNAHGTCSGDTGKCQCFGGWFGEDCGSACPGLLETGMACGGHGVCNATSGSCSCNPPRTGEYCQTNHCADPSCGGRGTCNLAEGVCVCEGGYTDPRCATPPPPSATHGIVGFATPLSLSVVESVGTVTFALERLGGAEGPITATCSTVGGSAVEGADFLPFSNLTVSWGEGDSAPKNLSVLVIQDALSESGEDFEVVIDRVQGFAILDPSKTRLRVLILPSASPPELAQIELEILVAWTNHDAGAAGSSAELITQFETEMTQALTTTTSIAAATATTSSSPSIKVQSMVSAEGGNSTGVVFLIFPDAAIPSPVPSEYRVTSLARRVVQEGVMRLPDSGIFASFPLLKRIDFTHQPLVLLKTSEVPITPVTPAGDGGDGGGGGKGWVVGLIVGCIFAFLVLSCCIVGYVKRRSLSEWALYRLGRFRFSRFREHGHAIQGEDEAEGEDPEVEDERGGGRGSRALATTDGGRALSPASASRNARGGPTELALRRDEERGGSGSLLVD